MGHSNRIDRERVGRICEERDMGHKWARAYGGRVRHAWSKREKWFDPACNRTELQFMPDALLHPNEPDRPKCKKCLAAARTEEGEG
jgi:hypothetical protein